MARRIDDHSFWAGRGSDDSVFPDGVHVKEVEAADGAGELERYEDTNEAIVRTQDEGERKIKSHRMKEGYRQ